MFQIADLQEIHCPLWAKEACYIRFTIFVSLLTIVVLLYIIIITVFIIYRQHINHMLKKRFNKYAGTHLVGHNDIHNVVVRYCDMDEEFVLKEVLPTMKCNKALEIHTNPIKNSKSKENFMSSFMSCVKDVNKSTTIVVFSSNYLMSTYSQVDIKKIHSEMLKADNTIYLFVDIGPENSIYAFLEEQRDVATAMVWKETNFWDKIFGMLSDGQAKGKYIANYELLKSNQVFSAKSKLPSNISFSKLPDWPNMYDLNTLTQSQV